MFAPESLPSGPGAPPPPRARQVLRLLEGYSAADSAEAASVDLLRGFLTRTREDPCLRSTPGGHVTASAVVLDRRGRALLLHHARLGIWVQPGGHLEPSDADVFAGAAREAREESGLHGLRPVRGPDGIPLLLDVDVHPIPPHSGRGEPAHHHHDLCFLLLVPEDSEAGVRIDPAESLGARWVSSDFLEGMSVDVATRRRLQKAFVLHAGGLTAD